MRISYHIGHAVAHWCLRIIPMPSPLRHRVAGTVATIPYLWWIWIIMEVNHHSWRAILVGSLLTGLLVLLVHQAENRRANRRP